MLRGVLCSTGAMITRHNGRDPRLLRDFFPRLSADGIELMIYPSWDGLLDKYIPAVKAISEDIGMPIPVLHMDKSIGEILSRGESGWLYEAEGRFRNNLDIANRLGSRLAVLHLWGGPASDLDIERNISVLGRYMELAKGSGVTLTVENVVCAQGSPLGHIRTIMREYPEALFTIDTKMAEFHRELPETLGCEELWNGRAAHLHVNDYGGGVRDFGDLRVLHMGEGHVDFAPFFARVAASGYDGFATVESTSVDPSNGGVYFGKLNATLEKVRNGIARKQ